MHAANRAGGVEELTGWFDFCKTAPAAPALVVMSRFLWDVPFKKLKISVETTAKHFEEEEEGDLGPKLKLPSIGLNHQLAIHGLRLTSLLLQFLKMDKKKRVPLKLSAPRQGPAPLRVKQGRLQGEVVVARLLMISTRASSNLDNVLSSVDSLEETMKRNHEHALKRSREVRQDAINSTSTILKDIKESIDLIKNLPEGEIGNGILGIAMHEVMTLNGRNDNVEQSEPTVLDDTITLNSTVDISSSADNTTAVMIGEGENDICGPTNVSGRVIQGSIETTFVPTRHHPPSPCDTRYTMSTASRTSTTAEPGITYYLRDSETGVVDTEIGMARRALTEMDKANGPDAESVDTKMGEEAIHDIRGGHLSGGGIVRVDENGRGGCVMRTPPRCSRTPPSCP